MEAVFGLQLAESQYYVVIPIISPLNGHTYNISSLVYVLQSSSGGKSTRGVQLTVRDALKTKKEESQKDSETGKLDPSDDDDDDDGDEADFDARMRMQILKKRKELGDLPPKPKLQNGMSII